MMADLDQYNAIKADWDHIQQSFAIEGVGPRPGIESGCSPSQRAPSELHFAPITRE
jgi:hypothetical protein